MKFHGLFQAFGIFVAFIICLILVNIGAIIDIFGIFKFNSFSFIDLIKISLDCFLILGSIGLLYYNCAKSNNKEIISKCELLSQIAYIGLLIIFILDFFRYGFGYWLLFKALSLGYINTIVYILPLMNCI